jgi:hypothetical protein
MVSITGSGRVEIVIAILVETRHDRTTALDTRFDEILKLHCMVINSTL